MGEYARMLVADDDPSVAITLQAILEQEGHSARAATSAEEARRLIHTQPFDVALLDLRLDDADGIELLKDLRERQPDCLAIMLTGYASLETAVRAIRFGAYDYLMKPCDLDELKLTIARALERVLMSRALRERLAELETANARISAFASELQLRVEEATAELNEKVEELTRAKQELENAQSQREQFISMVAHELAQPLTNINGYAQMLTRPTLSNEARERAHASIAAGTRRLTRLVQDLADAMRFASGSFRLRVEACGLEQIVTEQVEAARVAAQGRRISWEGPSDPIAALG
jgi:DNA-binding response OmpR family regulator